MRFHPKHQKYSRVLTLSHHFGGDKVKTQDVLGVDLGRGFCCRYPVREVIHTLIPVDNHRLIHRVLHNFVDNLQTGEKETRRNQAKDKVT
jgi:hypothetical protein